MKYGLVKILILLVICVFLLKWVDKFWGRKASNLPPQHNLKVETGDLFFRSNSYFLAQSRYFYKSGIPGHLAIVLDSGEFLSIDPNLGNCKVIEARLFDHSQKKWVCNVGITQAAENFGPCRGRRFLLKTHLSENQKQQLIQFVMAQQGKPFNLLAAKNDSNRFNCATFVNQAFIKSIGYDLDSDGGWIVFPNDILKNPLFDKENDRIWF